MKRPNPAQNSNEATCTNIIVKYNKAQMRQMQWMHWISHGYHIYMCRYTLLPKQGI